MKETIMSSLKKAGHEVQLIDLYAQDFNPVMSSDERGLYHEPGQNELPVREHIDALLWCDSLIFVYPTWWYGMPAMLKGWMDRVWVPHVAFVMPTEITSIKPNMQHIKHLAAITTCGASWFISKLMGEPGRKQIMRGIRSLCHKRCKTLYMAHYKMDTTSRTSLKHYLGAIENKLSRFAAK